MNKRARMRLIAVTVVILVAVTGFLIYAGKGKGAYYKTVSQVTSDQSLVGQRVRVAGAVVKGSWDKTTDPMKFKIRAEDDKTGNGPVLNVVYQGNSPSAFGDGVVAIVTGDLKAGNTIESNDMITKCPSKYKAAQGVKPVTDVVSGGKMVGKTGIEATGYVVKGSIKAANEGARFVVSGTADGTGKTVEIMYDGALPSGMTDGSMVVLTGAAQANGSFKAEDVALAQEEK